MEKCSCALESGPGKADILMVGHRAFVLPLLIQNLVTRCLNRVRFIPVHLLARSFNPGICLNSVYGALGEWLIAWVLVKHLQIRAGFLSGIMATVVETWADVVLPRLVFFFCINPCIYLR